MVRLNWRLWTVIGLAIGLSGCMLCDRYCDRQQDRCRSMHNPACTPVPANCCPPGTGSFYPAPVQSAPPPHCP